MIVVCAITNFSVQSKNSVSVSSAKETFIGRTPKDTLFGKYAEISQWRYETIKGEFSPDTTGMYIIQLNGLVKNVNKALWHTYPARVSFIFMVNGEEKSVGNYSINLAKDELKEFSHIFKIALNEGDIIKFRMDSDGARLIKKQASSNDSALKMGESIGITIHPADAKLMPLLTSE